MQQAHITADDRNLRQNALRETEKELLGRALPVDMTLYLKSNLNADDYESKRRNDRLHFICK